MTPGRKPRTCALPAFAGRNMGSDQVLLALVTEPDERREWQQEAVVAVEAVKQGALLLTVRFVPGGVHIDDSAPIFLPRRRWCRAITALLKARLTGFTRSSSQAFSTREMVGGDANSLPASGQRPSSNWCAASCRKRAASLASS